MKNTLFALTLSAIATQASGDVALDTLRDIRITQGPASALDEAQALVAAAPRNAAYRFELGVIQAELGECRQAWNHFRNAVTLLPLENVKRARDIAMADLCPTLAPWEGGVSMEIIADNNYNNAPDIDTIIVGGLPFTLSPESKPQKRHGIRLNGTIAYNHEVGQGRYIVPSLSGQLTLLDQREDSEVTLTPGIAYRSQTAKTDWRMGPALSYTFDENGTASQSYGLVGNWAHSLNAQTTVSINGSAWNVDARNDNDDGENYSLGLNWIRALDNGNVLTLGVSGTQKNRDLDQNTLSALGAQISYRGALTQNLGFDISAGITRINAAGENPFFQTKREDIVASLSGAISFAQWETPLGRPYVGFTYANSSSSIALYEYDKTSLRIGFSRQF